jgi:GNAT superfamily N-acetyltransferase
MCGSHCDCIHLNMIIVPTKELTSQQAEQINKLWNDEYPVKLKDRFPILLDGTDDHQHYLIEDLGKNVIAWAVYFEKDKQIRFSIIVSSLHKGKGLGGMLIEKLKETNREFYGWVIDHNDDLKANGEYYQSPLAFYLKHVFTILNDYRLDTEMIKAVLIKWHADQ